jgi:hypothetical protein
MIRLSPRFHQSFVAKVSKPSKGALVYDSFSGAQLIDTRKIRDNNKKDLIVVHFKFHIRI